jgi:hypothetical protein
MKFITWSKLKLLDQSGYAAIPNIIAAVGVGVSAYGQYQSGQAQEKAYKQQASIAEADATAEKTKAVYEERQARDRLKALIGTQRTLYAKAGVDLSSGSPLLVLADTAAKGEEDLQMIRYGGDVNVARQRNQATLARFYGSSASKAGTIGAIGSGLSGFSNAYTGYQRRTIPSSTVGYGG